MGTKLEIDHKTIRELFNKDPEFEIAVRQNILTTALKGRCKSAANAKLEEAAEEIISSELSKLVGDLEGPTVWSQAIKLNGKMKSAIKAESVKVIREEVRTQFNSALKEVNREIAQQVEGFKELIRNYMEDKFNESLEKFAINEIESHLSDLSEEIRKRVKV